jgi:translation initiation factor IF-2
MKKNAHVPPIAARPPVVAVLGHVDHGKTTLLDAIRKTNVASSEHGGITQHIGAYQVKIKSQITNSKSQKVKGKSEAQERLITFIDTPGHEAFAKMRSRGATVADIAILVVAADDSVMPQTKESIDQIKKANIPIIVAVNKTDLPTANPDRVKRDLASAGVAAEGFGGDVPLVTLSAKTGDSIPAFLALILSVADSKNLKSEPAIPVEAAVVETRVDKGKGTVATLIVKRGTIRIGTELYDGSEPIVRVRGMFDDAGRPVREAGPSTPVEVMGFRSQPAVGSLLTAEPADRLGAAQARTQQAAKPRLPDFLKPMDEEKEMLKVVLKADTAGSLEAIVQSLGDRVTLVGGGVGDIAEADVFLAKTSSAIIVGFNVNISSSVQMLAQTEKVVLRTYRIIYKLIEEIEEVILGLREVTTGERELGKGEIIAEFPFDKHRIAGTKVVSGRLSRGDFVRVMRAETEVGRAKIRTLRQGKEDINRAQLGSECGVLLDYAVDFQLGDAIIAVTTG